ncbi:(2Fe-2S)-binding protein [Pseudoroseomonas globiformis]|uniref:(2Fe-2S)-binding protein n=1 Tax=Teichococcus globiformis TaxID=2307229 RepID=A0ABV7G0Q4_9PROT
MFAQRPDIRPATVEVLVAGQPVRVPEGASAAAAILTAGIPASRETPVTGSPRLPYCMMGVCFDCLAEIDGVSNRQACMVTVAPGMAIAPQRGARHGYRAEDAA